MKWREGFERAYAVLAWVWIIGGIAVLSNFVEPEYWISGALFGVAIPLVGIRITGALIAWVLEGFRPKPKTVDQILDQWRANDNEAH